MKKIIVVLILIFILVPIQSFNKVSSADKIEDLTRLIEEKKKEEERIEKAIKEINAHIEEQKKKKEGVMLELNIIENNISRAGEELKLLENEEEKLKLSYKRSLNEIEMLTDAIEKGEKQLNKILFTLYKNYTLNYSAYIFSSKSFNEIMDKSIYLQFLISADKSSVKELRENKDKKSMLIEEQVDNQVKLSVVLDDKKKKIDELTELERKKENEISKVTISLAVSDAERNLLIEEHDRIEREIKELIKAKEEELRKKRFKQTPMGPLIWPVEGPVSSGFGMRLHPIFGVYRMHTGIDIDAPYGAPVKAVQNGYVIFAGWLGGYGNTVVIQHDEKHSTLYGHLRYYDVSEEQFVKQGDIIGKVGSTGWSTGPHLHFEVRINGEPVNPLDFLP